ncbi:hypothetical protein [Paenibacillus tundrae]|uniref:hypothetical protein n=1 Tax=Paenibacillus tundrae TaxID=528187 RepID=UPI0022A91A54|nr:hypothetical protein [Paenibacillus tundrae]
MQGEYIATETPQRIAVLDVQYAEERLPAVQASHYFLLSNELMQDGISATETRVLGMLDGGEQQCVHSVDAATWIGCYGPIGVKGIVGQIEQALLG